ncbi:FAD dependent oxidoreductase-like protein superfamily [Coniella lustricola]|uniref:FAD dependent oxidoreductase-like protein superfamily n=1 Tax=Coniella lustricola TaxID=2025994 RepID=A0A2T2ZT04_9PEZI|nr:FAD dependent oxidoreductase-like protein superfamily [Coniella lustricola]
MATETTILGAGIIGLSTAYYLAQHQPASTIHVVEAAPELFASASGYAGGFLARDWFGPATASLGALSFDEHRRLAEAHDGGSKWSYRTSTAVSYTSSSVKLQGGGVRAEDWLRTGASRATAAGTSGGAEKGDQAVNDAENATSMALPWLRREQGDDISVIGDPGTTAQLDPTKLCQFLLDECVKLGVRLHHPAKALAAMTDMRNQLSTIRIQDTKTDIESDLPCARLIIATGCWSPQVFSELFTKSSTKLPVTSLAGHSLVLRSPRWTEQLETAGLGCHAMFATNNEGYSPELFTHAGGEIWIGGLNSATIPLPLDATQKQIQAESIAQIKKAAVRLLGPSGLDETEDLEVIREGLCFRPVTARGTPIISRVEDKLLGEGITTRSGAEGGVFVATGHGPWGISQSLGTGMVLAEMAQGRELSADVSLLAMP